MSVTGARTASVSHAMVWFAGSYVGAVLGFLAINAVAGRWLGPDGFGFFIAAMAAAGLLGQVGLVGSHRSGLREVAQLRDTVDPEAMAVLRNGVRAVSLTTLPAAGVLGGIGGWLLAPGLDPAGRLGLSLAMVLVVVLGGQQLLWANYVRGLGHIRLAGLLQGRSGGALVAVTQASCIWLAWVVAPQWGIAGALGALAAGFVVPVLVARTVVRRAWRDLGAPAPRVWRDLRRTVRRDWRFLSAQVATFLNVSIEVWLAGVLLDRVDTSMFAAGQRLALLLVIPLTVLQVVMSPVVARASVTAREDGSLEGLLRAAATTATAGCVLLAVPMVVAPSWVLGLAYGPGFAAAVPVLLLISLASVGNVATGLAGTTLSMLGREDVTARAQWSGALLRVALGVPAALTWGLLGLTLSALTASIFVFTWTWWRARRVLGLSTQATWRPDLGLLLRTPG